MRMSLVMTQAAADKRNVGRLLLVLLVCGLLIAALAAAKPWLKATIGDIAFDLVVLAVAILGLGCANFLSNRVHRQLDEVQKAAAEFAARWSVPAGTTAFCLLLFLPPVLDVMTSMGIAYGDSGPGMTVDRSVVKFAMVLGFMGVVMLQAIATVVLNAMWWKSK